MGSSYSRPEYGSSSYLDTMGRASDYESAYAPITYNTTSSSLVRSDNHGSSLAGITSGSRLDLNNGSCVDLDSPGKYGEERVNSVLRKYPKYSSGTDYTTGVGAGQEARSAYGLAPSASSSALAKSRSYSNFDSLKRTDFSNLNTLGQVSHLYAIIEIIESESEVSNCSIYTNCLLLLNPSNFARKRNKFLAITHKSKCSYI